MRWPSCRTKFTTGGAGGGLDDFPSDFLGPDFLGRAGGLGGRLTFWLRFEVREGGAGVITHRAVEDVETSEGSTPIVFEILGLTVGI